MTGLDINTFYSTSRARRLGELFGELARFVEGRELGVTAYAHPVDEDLGHGLHAAALFGGFPGFGVVPADMNFLEGNFTALQERLGLHAVGAGGSGVDDNGLHGAWYTTESVAVAVAVSVSVSVRFRFRLQYGFPAKGL